MELFPAQPDLSLQITPPSNGIEESLDFGFWTRALVSNSTRSGGGSGIPPAKSAGIGSIGFDLSLSSPSPSEPSGATSNLHRHPLFIQDSHLQDLGSLPPIRGIPVYYSSQSFNLPHPHHHHYQQHFSDSPAMMATTSSFGFSRPSPSRFLPRFPGKRSMRAPRMRWTSTLHARFVHAVELLGGHERATPKSVLELMDVKDLTLAHVKSHLQMYRTVKTTDKAAASSGQTEPIEISDDNLFDLINIHSSDHSSIQNGIYEVKNGTNTYELWSNTLRKEGVYPVKPKESTAGSISSFEKNQARSFEMMSDISSSGLLETLSKKPNLEFTLGRPQ